MFLQIKELSWLQWHPFSVSSSPLDGKHHISILIKVLGNWTQKLRGQILSVSEEHTDVDRLLQPNLKLKASVEGPYGHESPYHLMYIHTLLTLLFANHFSFDYIYLRWKAGGRRVRAFD